MPPFPYQNEASIFSSLPFHPPAPRRSIAHPVVGVLVRRPIIVQGPFRGEGIESPWGRARHRKCTVARGLSAVMIFAAPNSVRF